MIVFRLKLNGKILAVMGREDLSVLSACITARGKLGSKSSGISGTVAGEGDFEVNLAPGGMAFNRTKETDQHFSWAGGGQLNIGDEISVTILESDTADKGISDDDTFLESAKKDVEELREKGERSRYEKSKKYYLENRHKYET